MVENFEIGGPYNFNENELLLDVNKRTTCNLILTDSNEKVFFTSSGRGAINIMLHNIIKEHQNINKVVLLPFYACESEITPFKDNGFVIRYYKVKTDLTIDIYDLFQQINFFSPSIIYFQSYFGFDTLNNIRRYYNYLRKENIFIVEDITHSWLSSFKKTDADYYVLSMRKWLEIPDGGALISTTHNIDQSCFSNIDYHKEIIDNFIEMSINKNLYFKSKDENKKSRYMFLVKKNKKILHENKNIYRLSDISAQILNGSDWEFIRDSRRQNYKMLFNELNETINFKPVFNHFPDDVVPLYFVILIKKDRTKFQKALINERIYCPIHWPIYNEIESIYSKESLNFQYQILSIPCDQRYNELDIKRIISTINNIN